MTRTSFPFIGRPSARKEFVPTLAFVQPGDEGALEIGPAPHSSASSQVAQRICRLIDEARSLRESARKRRIDARRQLTAARRAQVTGDCGAIRGFVREARHASWDAGKSDAFASMCERRARAVTMSMVHQPTRSVING